MLLLAISLLAALSSPAQFGIYFDLICISIVFPVVVFAAQQTEMSGHIARVSAIGGALSYPIYLLHYPFYTWYEGAFGFTGSLIAAIILVPIISFIVLRWFDAPIRGNLTRTTIRPAIRLENP
jgi:peptidoglycan/LPS O-acetylase OafA/YrhL